MRQATLISDVDERFPFTEIFSQMHLPIKGERRLPLAVGDHSVPPLPLDGVRGIDPGPREAA